MNDYHAKLSPSSAERWLQCPGSIRLMNEVGVGTHIESGYAREGTMAHRVAEIEASRAFGYLTKRQHDQKLQHWRDTTPTEYHTDMLYYAAGWVALLQSFLDEHDGCTPHVTVYLEKRVDPGIPASWGTADAIIVCLACGQVHVIDYKYGMGVPVFAEDNPQLMIYGLGGLEDFGNEETQTICLSVHQPRISNDSHFCMDADALRLWRDLVVLPQARLALSDDAYLSPSDAACRFCPVSGQCSVRSQYMTRRDFGNPELLSPQDLSEILSKLDDFEDWCKRVRETALHRAYYDDVEIPDYKVVMSGGRRSIRDHEAAAAKLREAGFRKYEVVREQTRTLGDLEKLVGKARLNKLLGPLIVKPEGKPSLVPADDERPAISSLSEAQKDFLPIEAGAES